MPACLPALCDAIIVILVAAYETTMMTMIRMTGMTFGQREGRALLFSP